MGGVINKPETGWELSNQLHGNRVVNREHLTSFKKCNYKIVYKKNKLASNGGKLLCMYANVRSIVSKLSGLELYEFEEKPDIIGLTESWTFGDLQDNEIRIKGYTLLREDRIIGDKVRGEEFYYIYETLLMFLLEKILFLTTFRNVFGVKLKLRGR